jgi:hypothetical protein
MQRNALETFVLGVFFTVAGFVLVLFRKAIREADENWNDRFPWFLQSHGPRGAFFEVLIILFGAFLILAGIVSLFGVFVHR